MSTPSPLVDAMTLALSPEATSPGTASSRRPSGAIRSAIALIVVLSGWELLARTVLGGSNLIAPPTGIVDAISDNWSLYQRATRTTLWEAARGFIWGNLAAVVLAAVVAVVPLAERLVLRVALVVFCLPLVAMGPVLRVVYGTGDGPQVTLAALAVFYTTLLPVLVGLRAVPSNWLDLVSSYGRGRFTAMVTIRARTTIPYLVAGLQVAAPAAFLGALVGEFTGADRGVGLLIINSTRALRTNELWAVATISALVSMAGYLVVGWLGRRLTQIRPELLMATDRTARGRTLTSRSARAFVEGAVTVVVVLGLWVGLMSWFDLDPYFAKRPTDVWRYLFSAPAAAQNRSEILDALRATATIAIPGYVVGLVLGAVTAAVFELSATARRTVTPFAIALRCVPIVAIAPLLIQAFGRDVVGTITTVAIMTFFPTLVACTHGLSQVPGQVLDVFAMYDVGRVRTLILGQAPAMVPAFLAAARIAVPATVLAATVAEWLATGTGIGNLMALAASNSRYATLWSCVVVVTAIAAIAYGVITAVETVVLRAVAPEQLSW